MVARVEPVAAMLADVDVVDDVVVVAVVESGKG